MLTFSQYSDSELAQYALDHSQDALVKALGARLLAVEGLVEEAQKELEEAQEEHADEIRELAIQVEALEGDDYHPRVKEALALIPPNTSHKGLIAIREILSAE